MIYCWQYPTDRGYPTAIEKDWGNYRPDHSSDTLCLNWCGLLISKQIDEKAQSHVETQTKECES